MNLAAYHISAEHRNKIIEILGGEFALNAPDSLRDAFSSSAKGITESVMFSLATLPNSRYVSNFTFSPMPGNCGIVVSNGVFVHPEWRKRGLGKLLNLVRIDIASMLGYGALLCTDVLDNIPQQKILGSNGWADIYRFINPRTKNNISVHMYSVNQ
jgi:GNAT superfamily N-acetyltransferase